MTSAALPTDTSSRLTIDVRTPGEYSGAHLPRSLNVPLTDLESFLPEIRQRAAGRPLLLVCRTGRRAEVARQRLEAEGLADCHVLEGGIESWTAGGGPVERGREGISLERQVRIAAGSLVAIGTLLGAVVSPWFLILPGFVGCGLVFAGVTDTCGMAMLLARLPFNRARTLPGPPVEPASA